MADTTRLITDERGRLFTNHRGVEFREFFPTRSTTHGPGWFVFGRNRDWYGGNYTMLCARPLLPLRRYKNLNCKTSRGWRTKREAQAVADDLNARYPLVTR